MNSPEGSSSHPPAGLPSEAAPLASAVPVPAEAPTLPDALRSSLEVSPGPSVVLSRWDKIKQRVGLGEPLRQSPEPIGAVGLGHTADLDTTGPDTARLPVLSPPPPAPREIPTTVHKKGELFGGDSSTSFEVTQRKPFSSELTAVHEVVPYASPDVVRQVILNKMRNGDPFKGTIIGSNRKIYTELTNESLADARYYADGTGQIIDLEDGTPVTKSADEKKGEIATAIDFPAIAAYEGEKPERQEEAKQAALVGHRAHYAFGAERLGIVEMSEEDKEKQRRAAEAWGE